MILVDSNIPMYLVGGAHPLKEAARRLLERCISAEARLVTDAEVLQEILHRYSAISRLDAIQPAFEAILRVVDEVYPVTPEDVERARGVLMGTQGLSARDALHLAVMERHGVGELLSFDSGFDGFPGVTRLH